MNLYCWLELPGQEPEEVHLIQTPTDATYPMMYIQVPTITERRPGQKRSDAARSERKRRPWQATAIVYLAWVNDQYGRRGARGWSPDVVKAQRIAVGRAWRRAQDGGGRLCFSCG